MRKIQIHDTTLSNERKGLGFKANLEICRLLQEIGVDTIELDEINDVNTEVLFIKTVSSFVKDCVISVKARSTKSIENAALALQNTEHPRIRVELPVSAVNMEYFCQKKPAKMLTFIEECISLAKSHCDDVELCATDATRAEKDFLITAVNTAVKAGATSITLCDSACEVFPDDFADFIAEISEKTGVSFGIKCYNKKELALASAVLSMKKGVSVIKTDFEGIVTPFMPFADTIKDCGNKYSISSDINYTQMYQISKQIKKLIENTYADRKMVMGASNFEEETVLLDKDSIKEDVVREVKKLGYNLSKADEELVYEEFLRVANNKQVSTQDLDAIIASSSLQVPPTYKLDSYLVTSSSTMKSNAHIILTKDGKIVEGLSNGNGPVDAAFLTLESIIGTRYELDDFQIGAVTRGKEAMGSAMIKLRYAGKIYCGNGISTDIICAAIRAYLNAVNKIVYEEK